MSKVVNLLLGDKARPCPRRFLLASGRTEMFATCCCGGLRDIQKRHGKTIVKAKGSIVLF